MKMTKDLKKTVRLSSMAMILIIENNLTLQSLVDLAIERLAKSLPKDDIRRDYLIKNKVGNK